MARFDAGTAVEELEFDFTKYNGGEGVIAEPTTGTVNAFFANMKSMLREVQQIQSKANSLDDVDLEGMDEAEVADMMGKVEETSEGASKFQALTVEYLSELCGAQRDDDGNIIPTTGSPTIAQLETLPYRALQAFSTWLVGEIRPKAVASRPSPRDRLRSGS